MSTVLMVSVIVVVVVVVASLYYGFNELTKIEKV